MTLEELDKKYYEASWIIAEIGAVSAIKLILDDKSGMANCTAKIGEVYGLTEEDVATLSAKVGFSVSDYDLSKGSDLPTSEADDSLGSLFMKRVGPAMLNRVKTAVPQIDLVLSAGHAVGTAGWFAYKARSFNLEAYQLTALRNDVDLSAAAVLAKKAEMDSCEAQPCISLSQVDRSTLSMWTENVTTGAVKGGAQLSAMAGGMFKRLSQRSAESTKVSE